MNYTDAINYINSMESFGIKPGLERIEKMMNYLGNPQKNLKFVHVAGTNGKGSVSTMIAAILSAEGYKTGLFTSPHVIDFRERFKINGDMISEDEFASVMTKVRTVNDIFAMSGCHLTHFELVTAVALMWFAEQKCQVVVMECGLGGRLDSTNIIEEPLCSVITKISLDHTGILGDTISQIASEKCGIIKQNCPTILAPNQQDEVLGVVAEACANKNSTLTISTTDAVTVKSMTPTINHIMYGDTRLMIPFAGAHQIENAVTAVNAVRVLNQRGLSIREENISAGIATARLPARFEVMSSTPLIIIDGAHNPDGIEALCNSIDTLLDGRMIIGIIGMLADKEYEESLSKIIPRFNRVFTVTPESPRALSAADLAKVASKYINEDVTVKAYDNLKKAAENAVALTDEASAVVVCGSLYLASAIRPIMEEILDD